MSLLVVLLIIWSVITAAFIIVVIYRAVIGLHEEQQLFLDRADAAMEREQQEVHARMERITPYLKYLGITSGALLVIILGVWLYQGLAGPQ
jgi:hypothetical protein